MKTTKENTLDKNTETLIEEAGLLIERLDDCFRSEANDSFHNYVGLVKQMTSIVTKELSTIATKSAEVEQIKSVPLSVMDIALFESLKINQHFGRRLNYPELKKFRSVSNWLKYLKKTNSFTEEAFREFREEVKLLYELSQPKEQQ